MNSDQPAESELELATLRGTLRYFAQLVLEYEQDPALATYLDATKTLRKVVSSLSAHRERRAGAMLRVLAVEGLPMLMDTRKRERAGELTREQARQLVRTHFVTRDTACVAARRTS